MEIQGIYRQSLTVPQIVKAQVGGARIALPVDGNLVYSNLKHISGIGSFKNQPAYSLNQLRALDNLIDRLKLMKGEKFAEPQLDGAAGDLSSVIDKYRMELHEALIGKDPLYSPLPGAASGISLNILV